MSQLRMSFSSRMMLSLLALRLPCFACNRCVECGDSPFIHGSMNGCQQPTRDACRGWWQQRVAIEALQMAFSAKDPGSLHSPVQAQTPRRHVNWPVCVCEAIPTTSWTLTPNLFGDNHLVMPSPPPPLSSFLSISHIIHSTLFHRDGDSHAPK